MFELFLMSGFLYVCVTAFGPFGVFLAMAIIAVSLHETV
jgi:hypothetical protein